jgi:ABC-type polysaccharide/polyol phosphate transport system ATPase subunit
VPPTPTNAPLPTAAANDLAVVVDGVSKTFRMPHEQVHTLKERAMHPFRRRTFDRFQALREVSFAVAKGEFFGIVGRNGSGKSTLLKCLAGIYRLDHGAIYLDGRVSTFIELGVGFNMELAARDNVLINGVMLGLTPREARARYDAVIDFAELREFEELKLKNYSSGMHVRLAFSVMIQTDADVLLIDEVLAVGDAAFQQKCFDVFNRLRDQGKTIIFVTHDMSAVRRFCHRAMLIDRGVMQVMGEPREVAHAYTNLNLERTAQTGEPPTPGTGDLAGELVEAWFEDERGERQVALRQGTSCTFHARVVFHQEVENPSVAVVFENEHHHALIATSSDFAQGPTGTYGPGDEVVLTVRFDLNLAPGRLFASPWVAHHHSAGVLIDRRARMHSAVIGGERATGGLLEIPHDVSLTTPDRVLTGRPS